MKNAQCSPRPRPTRRLLVAPLLATTLAALGACESRPSHEELLKRRALLQSTQDRLETSNRERRERTRGDGSGGRD